MTNTNYNELDIVKVYKVKKECRCDLKSLLEDDTILLDNCLELVWEGRVKREKMTLKEIEEKLGYKIEIIE